MVEPTDEVDRIVSAWERERPDLPTVALSVFSRITRLARYLDRARRAAFAQHNLEVWEFDVLTALRRAGHPYELTPGKLMTETMVSSGTMTNRIDRLVAHGLVRRAADPKDRRMVRVRLTDAGLHTVDAAMTDLLRIEAEVMQALPRAEQERLAGLLRHLLVQFES